MSASTLVTGGTGFLGKWLVRRLVDSGEQVRVLSRAYDAELEELGVEVTEGSLTEPTVAREATRGIRRIYHLAGRVERDRRHAHKMYEIHVDGTRNLLRALVDSEVEKVVVASTSGTVGVGEDPDFMAYDDFDYAEQIVKRWPYYLSKIYAERVCDDFARRHQLPIVQMRPTLLLGPEDRRESSTGDVVLFLQRKIGAALPGGLSFVDVRDAADAFIAAMHRAEPGSRYLLGAANMTLGDFFAELERLSGVPAPSAPIPPAAAVLGARLLDAAARIAGREAAVDPVSVEMASYYWYVDSSNARRDLGFAPRDPSETLRDTVNWIRRNHPDFRAKRRLPDNEWVRPETLRGSA